MAAKKKSNSGWNSLSASQQSDFKAKNFDKSIKVSESTIQGLRDGKTFEGNVAKFKSGMTAEQREAMNRFYGKNRVGAALGAGVSTINKTYPANSYNIPNKTTNNPGSSYKGAGSTNYTPPKKSGPSMGSMAGNFVKNELLGVDDFSRTVKYAKSGNIGGAIKSGLTGTAELGSTALTLVGSAFTGGALGGAVFGAKAAAFGAKAGVKAAAKQGAKQTAKTAAKSTAKATTGVAKSVVKTAATGSVKTGVKNVGKGVVKAPKAAVGAYKARGTMTPAIKAAEASAKAASTASRTAAKAYKAKKAEAGGKFAKGMGASYDAMTTAGKANAKALSAAAKLKKTQAAKLKKGKMVRQGARRAQAVHVVTAVSSKKSGKK